MLAAQASTSPQQTQDGKEGAERALESPFAQRRRKGAAEAGTSPEGGGGGGATSREERASVSASASFPMSMTSGDLNTVVVITAAAEDLFFALGWSPESSGSDFRIFLRV